MDPTLKSSFKRITGEAFGLLVDDYLKLEQNFQKYCQRNPSVLASSISTKTSTSHSMLKSTASSKDDSFDCSNLSGGSSNDLLLRRGLTCTDLCKVCSSGLLNRRRQRQKQFEALPALLKNFEKGNKEALESMLSDTDQICVVTKKWLSRFKRTAQKQLTTMG